MPASRAPGTPPAVLPAPPRASTPLPASFTLRQDASLRALDGGRVLLAGSPLRLFRVSERGRALMARWQTGQPVGPGAGPGLLARRLVSAGAMCPRPRGSTLGPRDVTVVIPVRDRPAQLERLLGSLGGLDCVVVDDASADPGTTRAIAEHHGARFVGLRVNAGPSGARNAGLAAARRPLVAFVDSDCLPGAGWLDPLLGHFDDPLVAAVAPRIVTGGVQAHPDGAPGGAPGAPRRRGTRTFWRYEAACSSLDRGPQAGLVRPGSPVPFVPSAALVVRAAVAGGPDLFDPALRGGEDVDLVWRLWEAGWDVRYVPESAVAHDATATATAYLRRQAFYGSTAGPLARRHPGTLAPLHASAWSVAAWAAVGARRPGVALVALGVPTALLARRLRGLVDDPVGLAARVVVGGTARGGLPSLAGLARAWSPALVAGLAFGRTRRACAVAIAAGALSQWSRHRDALDPVRFAALHVADDVAYGLGVWAGCLRAATCEPLLPRLTWRSAAWSPAGLRRDLAQPAGPGARTGPGTSGAGPGTTLEV